MMLDEVLNLTPDTTGITDNRSELTASVSPSNPPIMIPGINEEGELFPIEKIKAHLDGIHHLALSVFIFDGDELLIQRRAEGKYHCGGQWANTCCTHPHFNENIEKAAHRRLKEELGFNVPLEKKRVVEYSTDVGGGLWEQERVHMFMANVSKAEITTNLNPEEVSKVKWIASEALHLDIAQNPETYTPWFRIYLSRFPDLSF